MRNSGISRKFVAEYGILAISRRNDGILQSYGTRIFSKIISGMRNFHKFSWICGSFICCLVKRGLAHTSVFLVSTMRIFSKLCTNILSAIILLFSPGWVKMSNNTNLCHHFYDKVAGRVDLPKSLPRVPKLKNYLCEGERENFLFPLLRRGVCGF